MKKAWLFGSYSRGEQRADSDVDILILPDKSQHFSLFTLSEIYEDLKELLGCEVDVITVGGLMPFAAEKTCMIPSASVGNEALWTIRFLKQCSFFIKANKFER